jgi:hypothetical protein
MVNHEQTRIAISRHFILLIAILACLVLLASTWTLTTAQTSEPERTATPTVAFLDSALGETATTEFLLSIDPLYVTATAFILQMTYQAAGTTDFSGTPAPSSTLIPTLTFEEAENLRLRLNNEMETAAGFSHPVFDHIAYRLVSSAFYEIASANQLRASQMEVSLYTSTLDIQIRRMIHHDINYVAVIVRGFEHSSDELLVFQLKDIPILIFNNIQDGVYHFFRLSFSSEENRDLGGFADRNGNGRLDLAVMNLPTGTCGFSTLTLLEMQDDGQLENIAPTNWRTYSKALSDTNDDGILEIKVVEFFDIPIPVNCGQFPVTHWYGWNGTAYVNISGELGESYYPDIQAYWDSLASKDGCLLPSYEMYQMLVSYIAMGRLQEGWARLGPLLQWEKCSPETLVEQSEEFGQFLEWIGTELQNELQVQQ